MLATAALLLATSLPVIGDDLNAARISRIHEYLKITRDWSPREVTIKPIKDHARFKVFRVELVSERKDPISRRTYLDIFVDPERDSVMAEQLSHKELANER